MAEKKQMLKARAYELLKKRIIRFELQPGQDIDEAAIAAELGVSRTPVREALLQLTQDGFVDMYHHKGIFVSQLLYQDMYDLYKMRLFFEIPAIEALCANLTEDNRKELLSLREYYDSYEYSTDSAVYEVWIANDSRLHMIMIESYGNRQFTELYKIIEAKCARIRYLLARNVRSRTDVASKEHVGIIDSVLNNEPKKAVEELIHHVGVENIIRDVINDVSKFKPLGYI